MDAFAQFLAGFQAYMDSTPQETIDARWESILANYSSDDLLVGDVDNCRFSVQKSSPDYFTTTNGRSAHEVHLDEGVMQLAA